MSQLFLLSSLSGSWKCAIVISNGIHLRWSMKKYHEAMSTGNNFKEKWNIKIIGCFSLLRAGFYIYTVKSCDFSSILDSVLSFSERSACQDAQICLSNLLCLYGRMYWLWWFHWSLFWSDSQLVCQLLKAETKSNQSKLNSNCAHQTDFGHRLHVMVVSNFKFHNTAFFNLYKREDKM